MNRLCIIPARGGSKRIPGKNIKSFLGKPIIAYSIEAALTSGLFSEVVVSTDSKEIAQVAKQWGAQVPFLRSAKNADDFATTADVIREVHETKALISGEACCLYATAPFASADLLRKTHERFHAEKWTTVFPALAFEFPIQRALATDEEGRMEMFYPEHMTTRSQDLRASYHDAGMFYWYRVEHLVNGGGLYSDNSSIEVIPSMRAHDIDTIEDWQVAEFKYRFLHESS